MSPVLKQVGLSLDVDDDYNDDDDDDDVDDDDVDVVVDDDDDDDVDDDDVDDGVGQGSWRRVVCGETGPVSSTTPSPRPRSPAGCRPSLARSSVTPALV